jgi:methylamine---glutamate N-methyltransferase subunit C
LTSEIQILARACGKSDVHHLEPEDMRALTLEASLITGVPLAGTNRVFGGGPGWKEAGSSH